MYTKPLPSQALIAHLFDYDPETGNMRWRARHTHTCAKGVIDQAGHAHGYRVVTFYKHTWLQHRLIWKLMTGVDPDPDKALDHIDEDPGNNRWVNLREISRSENVYRSSKHKRTSWARSIRKMKSGGFQVIMGRARTVEGVRTTEHHHVGVFDTEAEARACPLVAKPTLGKQPPKVQAKQQPSGRWSARVWDRKNKRKIHLGTFDTKGQALDAKYPPT
jgi:hypothetical protein